MREIARRERALQESEWKAKQERAEARYRHEVDSLRWFELSDDDACRYRIEMNRRGLTMPRRYRWPVLLSWTPHIVEATLYRISDKRTLRRFAAIWEAE